MRVSAITKRAQPRNVLCSEIVGEGTAEHHSGGVKPAPANLGRAHQRQNHAEDADDPGVDIGHASAGQRALGGDDRIAFDIGDVVPNHPREVGKYRGAKDPRTMGQVLADFAEDVDAAQAGGGHHGNDITDNGGQPSDTKKAQPRQDHTQQSVANPSQAKP